MPELEGGADKINKRARGQHASHQFLGIHDKEMRRKSVDINVSREGSKLLVALKNKMDHPLIIQSARAKYLTIKVVRDGKVIWKNFLEHPSEDKQGYFAVSFKRNGKKILIPATATEQDQVNNLGARESKILTYDVGNLQKGDSVEVSLYVKLAKDDCMRAVSLKDTSINKPLLMKAYKTTLK